MLPQHTRPKNAIGSAEDVARAPHAQWKKDVHGVHPDHAAAADRVRRLQPQDDHDRHLDHLLRALQRLAEEVAAEHVRAYDEGEQECEYRRDRQQRARDPVVQAQQHFSEG